MKHEKYTAEITDSPLIEAWKITAKITDSSVGEAGKQVYSATLAVFICRLMC